MFVSIGIVVWSPEGSLSSKQANPVMAVSPSQAESGNIFSPNYKPESEKEYKASCKKIVGVDDGSGIYYKDLLKNPNKYISTRLNIQAKIMSIEESNNQTAMQVYISRNFDTAIVYYDGVMKIYEDDIIRIWGEGAGTFEGQNRMGAAMSVPMIRARYIKQERSE